MPNPFLRDAADPTGRIYSDALNSLPAVVPPAETALPSSPPAQAPARQPKARRAVSNIAPDAYRPLFEAASRKHKVPLNLLMALESGFNPPAEGPPTQWGAAKGMMQYLDGTAAGLGINPFDPAQAVDAAAKQFAERLAKGYSPEEAVQAHFAGDDRALWKDKTERYRQEVLERAADIKRFYLQRPADEPKPAARRDWALREAKGTEAGGGVKRVTGWIVFAWTNAEESGVLGFGGLSTFVLKVVHCG